MKPIEYDDKPIIKFQECLESFIVELYILEDHYKEIQGGRYQNITDFEEFMFIVSLGLISRRKYRDLSDALFAFGGFTGKILSSEVTSMVINKCDRSQVTRVIKKLKNIQKSSSSKITLDQVKEVIDESDDHKKNMEQKAIRKRKILKMEDFKKP